MHDKNLHEQGLATGGRIYGKDGYRGLVERVQRYDSDLADYLVENAFGQVLSREGLDLKTRMLCNVAALTALGIDTLLRSYLRGALNAGATETEVKEVLIQMYLYAGWPRCLNALGVYEEILQENRSK
jgi:4-carboxymuconolactone decarboxylase